MSDPLGGLIVAYGKVLQNHHKLPISNPEQLIEDLQRAAQLRNVLCHGSWQVPDAEGKSLPLFVDKKLKIFATPIDVAYLQQVRDHVAAWPVRSSIPSAVWACSFPDRPGRAGSS